MLGMNDHDETTWMIPVQKTEALRDVGVPELIEQIQKHQEHLTQSGKREQKLREGVRDLLKKFPPKS